MTDIRDKTIREIYEDGGREGGRVISWKEIAGVSTIFCFVLAGLLGAGRYIFLNFPHSEISTRDFQLGWICIGIVVIGCLLVVVGLPLYMRRKPK